MDNILACKITTIKIVNFTFFETFFFISLKINEL